MNTNSTKNQTINGFTVSIMVHKSTGQRYADIQKAGQRFDVPIEMLSLAAGKDAWMKEILVKCAECRTAVKAGEMECSMCPACYDKAGAENEALDNGGAK